MSLFVKAIDKLQIERAKRKRETDIVPIEKPKPKPAKNRHKAAPEAKIVTVGDKDIEKSEPVLLRGEAMIEAGMIVDENVAPYLKNEMRTIKRPLLNNAFGAAAKEIKRGKLVLITSALPEEGKSFMALQLALSIAAEQERTVMLVDADLTRPRLTSLACGDRSIGLSDVLEDNKLSVSDVLRKTDVPGLSFLPAGQHHSLSTELLASDRMLAIVEDICEQYSNRVIIIDSAPLLVSNDAQVLSSLVGQVALVVKAESTPVHTVGEARELIAPERPVSAILNQYKGKTSVGYYGGYYDEAEKQLKSA